METVKNFFSSCNFWDYLFLLILIFTAIRGAFRGFIATIMNAIALVGGVILSYFLYKPLSSLVKSIGITKATELVAFLLIFILFYLIVKICENFVEKITQNDSINNLNRALGFFLGILIGGAIIFLFVIVVGGFFSNFFHFNLHLENSRIAGEIEKIFDSIYSSPLPSGGKNA